LRLKELWGFLFITCFKISLNKQYKIKPKNVLTLPHMYMLYIKWVNFKNNYLLLIQGMLMQLAAATAANGTNRATIGGNLCNKEDYLYWPVTIVTWQATIIKNKTNINHKVFPKFFRKIFDVLINLNAHAMFDIMSFSAFVGLHWGWRYH